MSTISGYHDAPTEVISGDLLRRRRDDLRPTRRRSIGRVRVIQSFMVYGLVAVLSFAGGASWQHKTNTVGRNSSVSDSSGYGVGLVATNRTDQYADSSYSNLGTIRRWVRVYDSAPSVKRLVEPKAPVATSPVPRVTAAAVSSPQPVEPPPPTPTYTPIATGDYSCSQLESLWEREGGNPHDAFVAAEIAMAESGGNPDAISPTDDYGLWQINASHGDEASLDPVVNARAAIAISDDGSDWFPWTTYTEGFYIGRC
jgi:hypothetical protein